MDLLQIDKLTTEYLNRLVMKTDYIHQGMLTICTITLCNGFQVVGTSACISDKNFNEKIGEDIAYKNAFEKLWELEGYLLKQRRYEAAKGAVRLRNGNAAEVVYQSPFGKLLVIEHNGDELPAAHWHNADGSFHKDENHQIIEHELDIVAGLE
ncbi:Gp49 family protein [Bisgaard Taxon 10/6]|uniref:Gp49 family protein n=1 Tax=Exercitatus varius TaxID=67857 RepID=UPI00294B34CC|nr:Gp49 family protein [Exercitatus varius]MDG2959898.1 Gp49 family protein [Exercitatus varius]